MWIDMVGEVLYNIVAVRQPKQKGKGEVIMSNEIYEAAGENKVANIVRIVGYAVMTLGGLAAAIGMFYWLYFFGWAILQYYNPWVFAGAVIAAGAAVAGLGCFLVWLITYLIWKKK